MKTVIEYKNSNGVLRGYTTFDGAIVHWTAFYNGETVLLDPSHNLIPSVSRKVEADILSQIPTWRADN